MAALAIRKTAWQGLSVRNRTILKAMGDVLQLGKPAEFESPSAVRWFIFDDWRFKHKVIAYLGCVLANLSEIPVGYTLPLVGGELDKVQLRIDIRTFCESPSRGNLLVWPVPNAGSFQDVLDAQNAPAAIQMASGVPNNWIAVSEE